MSVRRRPTPCDNPVCRREIEPDRALSLKLVQVRADGKRGGWILCDVECLRQYLAFCRLKNRVAAEVVV